MRRSIFLLVLLLVPRQLLSQVSAPPPITEEMMRAEQSTSDNFDIDSSFTTIEGAAMYNKNLPFEIEQHLTDSPKNPKLCLEIGRAFLAQAIYFRAWQSGSACDDTAHYSYLDSASDWYSRAIANGMSKTSDEFHPYNARLFAARVAERLLTGDGAAVTKLLIEARIDSAISDLDLDLTREIFAECEHDGILFTGSSVRSVAPEVLLSGLYLQDVQHERTDLSIISSALIVDNPYYDQVRAGIPGVMRGLEFLPRDARAFEAAAAGLDDPKAVAYAYTTTLSPEIRAKLKRDYGVTSPATVTDSGTMMRTTYPSASWNARLKWIALTSGWTRPMYKALDDVVISLSDMDLSRDWGAAKIGLVSELLPTAQDIHHGQYLKLKKFYARPGIVRTLATKYRLHEYDGYLFETYATAWRAEPTPDTTVIAKTFTEMWDVSKLEHGGRGALLGDLAIALYPKHTPPSVKAYLEAQLDSTRPRIGNDGSSYRHRTRTILGSVQTYVQLAMKLGRCEDVAKTLKYLHTIDEGHDTSFDDVRPLVKGTIGEIQIYSSALPCIKRVITGFCVLTTSETTNFDTLQQELSNEGYQSALMGTGSQFHPQDSIHAFCILINAHAGESVTARWFNGRTGQIVRTDAGKTEDLVLPDKDRRGMPPGESIAMANFHISNAKGLPHGVYHVDIIMQGEVVTSQTMSVPDLEK